MLTLLEFASDKMLTELLVKERAKFRVRNRSDKHHTLDKNCPIEDLSVRKQLSRMMPPRATWVKPSKRARLENGTADTSKNAQKAILLTIKRDRRLQEKDGKSFEYLDVLDSYTAHIKARLESGSLSFESPVLMPIYKSTDGDVVTCRPLSSYRNLEDKIILALTSRYLTRYFNKYLHENILSYRQARDFHGKKHYTTTFNDGVELIKDFRQKHHGEKIYASDCDIKKFYDIIPHRVVLDCFDKFLDKSDISKEGKNQVMRVLEAYLNSYNFWENAWREAESHPERYAKVRRRLHDKDGKYKYELGWVEQAKILPEEEKAELGVPQGGALSLLVANVVLNDVDSVFPIGQDSQMLFIRYCDDMILLHTDYNKCSELMKSYTDSLMAHGLYYHEMKALDGQDRASFWQQKSHEPFLWGDGEGNSNRYIGFLGYEMRRDEGEEKGRMRLRKSNIKRFDEKYNRIFYALRRYSKDHNAESFEKHEKKVLQNIIDGVNFYTALDFENFKKGRQFKHLVKMQEKLEKRLRH